MLITILSAEYLISLRNVDVEEDYLSWSPVDDDIVQARLDGGRWSKLVTRKQCMRSTHSLLQIISWGGPGLILLQLYRQLLPRNIITRLGFIMSIVIEVKTLQLSQICSPGSHWENHAIPHFIIIMMNCQSSQWFQQIFLIRDNLWHSADLEI